MAADANSPEMLRYWVWLSMVFGAGSTIVYDVFSRYESPEAVYDAMMAGMVRDLPPAVRKAMVSCKLAEAEKIVYFCQRSGITLLPVTNPEYPAVLLDIAEPPILLTAMGNLSVLRHPLALAVVGTRRPTEYAEHVTASIISSLCMENDFVIISGLARGIDAEAHTAALDAGGRTVAVLGCGVNVNYPRENAALRSRILSSDKGLLLSEYLPGTQPYPPNFPKRNRILSGLAYMTAIIEAAGRSGSLITAQLALDQGRLLACVPPPNIFDDKYAGVIPFLRDGAIPLMSYQDVLLEYYYNYPHCLMMMQGSMKPSQQLFFACGPEEETGDSAADAPKKKTDSAVQPAQEMSGSAKAPAQDAPAADAPAPAAKTAPDAEHAKHLAMIDEAKQRLDALLAAQKAAAPQAEPPVPERDAGPLPEEESAAAIVRYLRAHGETYADDLASALDMDLSALLSELTMLELDGFVESLFGKVYRAV